MRGSAPTLRQMLGEADAGRGGCEARREARRLNDRG
jgi:hypothetical protein